ncbi:hypothetical protein AC40_5343 [Escherichia coli 2-005-03_S3_C3]|nr:hypothetical protein AC40_5343 [Escherichia coli 2-005-03_S3_C3]
MFNGFELISQQFSRERLKLLGWGMLGKKKEANKYPLT